MDDWGAPAAHGKHDLCRRASLRSRDPAGIETTGRTDLEELQ